MKQPLIALLARTVRAIYLSECKTYLIFQLDTHIVVYEATGDCCSSSWFETINHPENIIGHVIHEITEGCISWDQHTTHHDACECKRPEDKDGEVTQIYGYTIKTPNGCTEIEYRNFSNGYYGGDCEEAKKNIRINEHFDPMYMEILENPKTNKIVRYNIKKLA